MIHTTTIAAIEEKSLGIVLPVANAGHALAAYPQLPKTVDPRCPVRIVTETEQ